MTTKIQFIRGINEKIRPDVRLTRSRDGSTGTARFTFKKPTILSSVTAKNGEITGMYLIDDEGVLETRDISVQFIDGKLEILEVIYIMKTHEAWNRFMRFMYQYSKNNNLIFTKTI